ncbi:hypothetical protein DERP_000716 [Dermatophagoides pteronyssinus]|uniref:Peroxidase-like n=1 Tax=Dermatophagoides pteronyssinus TaxID=6956 RepID=A0ABQ8J128_DERPT|nr:hypothetical protein DERP_000716 [Dermatophagoides pteronyssinus]
MFYNHPNIVNAYHHPIHDQTLISIPEYHQIIIEENEDVKLIEKRDFFNGIQRNRDFNRFDNDNNRRQFFDKNFDNDDDDDERINRFENNDGKKIITTGQCRTNDGFMGVCWPIGLCHYQYGNVRYSSKQSCRTLVNGKNVQGVCCPLDVDYTPNSRDRIPYRLTKPRLPRESIRITRNEFLRAIQQADADITRYLVLEEKFTGELGQVQIAFTPAFFLQMMFGPADQNQQLTNLWGFRALQLTRALGENLNLSPKQLRDGLSSISMYGTPYEQYCLKIPDCDERYPYRTIDGSCNNIRNPLWGKSLTQFERLLPPEYSDGISELRISINGRPLPPPRAISTGVFETSGQNDARFSDRWNVMFMQWGQFLDHDITLGSSTRASNGQGLLCCNRTNEQGPLLHPACRPIYLPVDDPYYSRFNRHCNNFVRNAVGPKNSCNLGYREQTNTVTSFIDASMIYGNDFNRSRLVRSFRNGHLKIRKINNNEWLPFDTMNNSLACAIRNRQGNNRCVFAGDVRVNQQFGITSLQLLFLREHNRLAKQLAKLNSAWDDEIIYQEARKIVSAEMQHITYNEFLPEALGRNVIRHYGLSLQPNGHCLAYDRDLNPSILNEFGAAAFRWHTLVQKYYHMINGNNHIQQRYEMNRIFNNPTFLYPNGSLDQAIRGILKQPTERFDRIFTEDIKNLLFAQQTRTNNNQRVGMDLISINIQRGRDHGIPTYNQIRQLCGLQLIRNFQQLRSLLRNQDDWQRLSQIYSHVDDIDFWVAGNLEQPLQEGILGPTFSCIVGEQFRRLKYGDRYWYENGQMQHSFTIEQLTELRKITLARIICDNSDRIHRIQPLAMVTISKQLSLNPELDCSSIPRIDLKPWKINVNGRNRGGGGGGGRNSNSKAIDRKIQRNQSNRQKNQNRRFNGQLRTITKYDYNDDDRKIFIRPKFRQQFYNNHHYHHQQQQQQQTNIPYPFNSIF